MFLEEAFGGLLREGNFPRKQVLQRLEVNATDSAYEVYKDLCWDCIREARLAVSNCLT